MSNLNATRIVDKNGKQTTVHKRTDKGTTVSAALSSLPPTLAGTTPTTKPKGKAVTKVKASSVARLHEESFIRNNPSEFEVQWIENGEEYYGWRKVDTELPTSRIYDYMRQGIDLTDATILDGLGISPEALAEDFTDELPGRLSKVESNKTGTSILHNSAVIDAMEQAGVPVAKAYKALENGLQDGHMKDLSIEQLVPLFTKWRYYGKQGTLPDQNSSRLLDAVTSGQIPYELTETATRQELSRLENELRYSESRKPLMELLGRDRDLFIRVAEKAVTTMSVSSLGPQSDKPVSKLLNLATKYGDEVLELRHPELITMSKKVDGDWKQLTMEEAQYCEAVEKLAIDAGDNVGVQWKRPFDHLQADNNDVTLRQSELAELHSNGVSAENAHEMLVLRKMSVGQALTAHTDNVPTSISEGAL
jgi:hypothetical protein